MSTDLARHPGLERHLSRLLEYGTWIGSSIIALGIVFSFVGTPSMTAALSTLIVAAGIFLIILLPIMRVSLMAFVFLCERDYRFGAIALSVLIIIALGGYLGLSAVGA
jgi:uncharacterized membrane protein